MAFDERGIQSLGIFQTKTVKRDGKTKEKLVALPIFFYASKDLTSDIIKVGYFKTDKFPNPFAKPDLNGAIILIKGLGDNTIVRKLVVSPAGVVTVADLDAGTPATGSITNRFKPEMLQMLGTNLESVGLWIYTDAVAQATILHADFWKNDGANQMERIVRNDKLNSIKNGDIFIIIDNTGKASFKTGAKKAGGGITFTNLEGAVGGAVQTKKWEVGKMQMLGTSNEGQLSNTGSIRNGANKIATLKAFAYTDLTTTLANLTHATYWEHKQASGIIDISKLSFVRGNMKNGDIIFIKGSDKTGMFKATVNPVTNVLTISAITAPTP